MSNDDWMTVDDALAHIMRVERCTRRTAMKKFRKALEDGKLDWRFAPEEYERAKFKDKQ